MFHAIVASGLLGLAAVVTGAEPLPAPAASGAEIIVEGRRTTDRYRIPIETRTSSPADAAPPPAAADPRIACHGVGAYGCGTDVLPLVTFRSDGSTQIGVTSKDQ